MNHEQARKRKSFDAWWRNQMGLARRQKHGCLSFGMAFVVDMGASYARPGWELYRAVFRDGSSCGIAQKPASGDWRVL